MTYFRCEHKCNQGTYGLNCSFACNCPTCHHISGQCPRVEATTIETPSRNVQEDLEVDTPANLEIFYRYHHPSSIKNTPTLQKYHTFYITTTRPYLPTTPRDNGIELITKSDQQEKAVGDRMESVSKVLQTTVDSEVKVLQSATDGKKHCAK